MILLFARSPVAGAVKTRLQDVLGPEGCARLQAVLVEHCLGLLRSAQLPFELWLDGPESELRRRVTSVPADLPIYRQRGANLGARMQFALQSALSRQTSSARRAAIVIGTDCPDLTAEMLTGALDTLRRVDVVLAPAADGGYVLVGCRDRVAPIFDAIDWGSERVLAQTRQRISRSGLSCGELPTLRDLDRPDELAQFAREVAWLRGFELERRD